MQVPKLTLIKVQHLQLHFFQIHQDLKYLRGAILTVLAKSRTYAWESGHANVAAESDGIGEFVWVAGSSHLLAKI